MGLENMTNSLRITFNAQRPSTRKLKSVIWLQQYEFILHIMLITVDISCEEKMSKKEEIQPIWESVFFGHDD